MLPRVELKSPAYALCLSTWEDDLVPGNISLGLDEDRARLIERNSEWDAWIEVWNPTGYRYDLLEAPDDDPSGNPNFQHAGDRIQSWLDEVGIEDAPRWVLEEVAAKLTRCPPRVAVTDDFVTFVYSQGNERGASLRWIAPYDVLNKLKAKGLWIDDPYQLQGAPRYDEADSDSAH